MSNSYDYSEIIEELKEEVEDLLLDNKDKIQILRGTKPVGKDYFPIVDWYYAHEHVMEDLEVEPDDSKKEIETKKKIEAQYMENRSKLEEIVVIDALEEMMKFNKPHPFQKFKK